MRKIERERFLAGGADLGAWRVVNDGIELRAAALGGAILSLRVPDRRGDFDDVVLGYEEPDSYAANPSYLGVLIGRFANRIAGARFAIDGREHRLDPNDGPNHLHGGHARFSHVRWRAEPVEIDGDPGLLLEHSSPDGAGGYPGNLRARVTYVLTRRRELVVDYHATCDQATHVNLTQHSYFNLAGHGAGDIGGHELEIRADRFLPVGEGLIPTGELRDVSGTPFDFRTATAIGARIDEPDEQLLRGRGYDHCFVLQGAAAAGVPGGGELRGVPGGGTAPGPAAGSELPLAARVLEPGTGRVLAIRTSAPGVQLYTGNYLGDGLRGKGGVMYGPRSGFALETQHFPDSPNRPEFPSTLLRRGEEYRSRTVYAFEVA